VPFVCVAACLAQMVACRSSSSTTAPSASTLHAEVADPAGDAIATQGFPNTPDLVHGVVDVAATIAFLNSVAKAAA